MAIVDDRIYETGSASGTTVSLGGRKSSGFRTFSQSNVGNGNQCRVVIDYKDPRTGLPVDEWAVVVATYNSSPNTLTINTWLKSSNGGSAVTWVSGRTYDVYIDVDSAHYLDKASGADSLTTATQVPYVSAVGTLAPMNGVTWTNSTGILTGMSGLGLGGGSPSSTKLFDAIGNSGSDIVFNVSNVGAGRGIMQIGSASSTTAELRFLSSGTAKWTMLSDHSANKWYVYDNTNTTYVLSCTSNGFGVFTVTPLAAVHITGQQIILQHDAAVISLWKDGTPTKRVQLAINTDISNGFSLRMYDGSTTVVPFVVANTTGKIGIGPGLTAPSSTLHVYDATAATGVTTLTITSGAGQSTTPILNLATTQNGAGASTGTLTNAPSATNPAVWIPVTVNGTTRYIPAW